MTLLQIRYFQLFMTYIATAFNADPTRKVSGVL